jgi:bacterial/archaeal transporter family-2 protein
MTSDVFRYGWIMLLAGIGIPVLAALNAQLGRAIASPTAAAAVLFFIALIATTVILIASGATSSLRLVAGQPKHLLAGGLLVAFYVLSVTAIAPRIGLGNAIFLVLLGQLLSASLIDHFGLFGALQKPVDVWRAAGLGLMFAGVSLAQRS